MTVIVDFWTPEMIELASRTGDDDAHAVVADWLEEHQCKQAAACFRLDTHRVWRSVLTTIAKTSPSIIPRGVMLATIEINVRAQYEMDQVINRMSDPYGFDLAPYFGVHNADPFPALPEC